MLLTTPRYLFLLSLNSMTLLNNLNPIHINHRLFDSVWSQRIHRNDLTQHTNRIGILPAPDRVGVEPGDLFEFFFEVMPMLQ